MDNNHPNGMSSENIYNNQMHDGQASGSVSHPLQGNNENINLVQPSMPRRSLEGSYIINNVIREFQQHVETARMVNARGISSLLSRPSTSDVQMPIQSQSQPNDSIVINLENFTNRQTPNTAHSNYQPANLPNNVVGGANNNNNNGQANNNAGDEPTTDTLRNVIEAQQSLEILQKYLPFVLILLAKGLYDHCEGIFNFIILFAVFVHSNSVVKREATKQTRRSLSKLFVALLYIIACFAFIAYIFEEEKLYLNLVFIPPYKQSTSVFDLLWTALITDFILKLVTIVFKILLTMLPGRVIAFQRRVRFTIFLFLMENN